MKHITQPIRWFIPANPADVYAALTDASGFPGWWDFFRSVERVGQLYRATVRGGLHFDLTLGEGNQSRVIEWYLLGDVNGTVRVALQPSNGGTDVTFDRRINIVGPTGPFMNWLAAGQLTRGETQLMAYLEENDLLLGDIPSTNDEVTESSMPLALTAGATALAILWWRRRG